MSSTDSTAERLHSFAIALLRLVRHVDTETRLGPAQLSALSVLVFGGPRTPGELAAIEQVTRPSMTRVLNELEAAGYVARQASPDDGRSIAIRATASGTRLLISARKRRTDLIAKWFDALPATERAMIARALPGVESLIAVGRNGR